MGRFYGNVDLHCKKRIHTLNGETVESIGIHNHAANPEEVQVSEVLQKLDNKAAISKDTPKVIVAQLVGQLAADIQAILPPIETLTRRVQRKREDTNGMINYKLKHTCILIILVLIIKLYLQMILLIQQVELTSPSQIISDF